MDPRTTTALLYLNGVSVSFDGFRALNNLSLAIEPGEMRAIIGPNGAGKTTMMDVVTGKTRPDTGDVYFDGAHDLTRSTRPRSPSSASAASSRSRPCSRCTPSRTICCSRSRATAARARRCSGARPPSEASRIDRILEHHPAVGACASALPAASSHGQKQWLEIGMLLAQEPKLLLVDEPVAGMTDAETRQTAELLKEINRDKTVVVVEHDMTFVRELGVKVTCLHEGSVLAEGTHRSGVGERARDRSLSGTVTRCSKSTPSICTTARRRRCAACR